MNIPQELKYTKDHEWVRVEGDTAVPFRSLQFLQRFPLPASQASGFVQGTTGRVHVEGIRRVFDALELGRPDGVQIGV